MQQFILLLAFASVAASADSPASPEEEMCDNDMCEDPSDPPSAISTWGTAMNDMPSLEQAVKDGDKTQAKIILAKYIDETVTDSYKASEMKFEMEQDLECPQLLELALVDPEENEEEEKEEEEEEEEVIPEVKKQEPKLAVKASSGAMLLPSILTLGVLTAAFF